MLSEIIKNLQLIEEDTTIPKNARSRIKNTISILACEGDSNIDIKIDRSLEELGDVVDDPNLPSDTRMQIWSVVSIIESKSF